MGKRRADGNASKSKKFKASGIVDPNTSGIYATCARGRELGCRKELMNLLTEKIETLYPDWQQTLEAEKAESEKAESEELDKGDAAPKKELSVEDEIQKELAEMKTAAKSKQAAHPLLHPIELGCECIVFIKVRKPALPTELVHALCEEALLSKQKKLRFIQKLSPVTYSVSASTEELEKMASRVLKPVFHGENQKPVKFAIQVTRRNFNAIEKEDIIKLVAATVGREHGHTVDLKEYDKLIMVECFKNNIGMSVVSDFKRFEKLNLQQIFEKDMGEDSVSRVKPT